MKRTLCCLLTLALLLLTACRNADETPTVGGGFAMGSYLSARLYGADAGTVNEILADVAALDGEISLTNKDSALSRLVAAGGGDADDTLLSLLRRSLDLRQETGGALDISLGAVTTLWGFQTDAPMLPDDAALREALRHTGAEKIRIGNGTLTLQDGVIPAPGAVGKGAALDLAAARLRSSGATGLVTFGGSVLLYGPKPDGGVWGVGVRDPKGGENDYFAKLSFSPQKDEAVFISTSGSYEKAFTENGRTYHHILDPKTGYPVENGLLSVTAVSDDGFLSDALSTALFVMGWGGQALALCGKYGVGAVFVFDDGRVAVTPDLADSFTLTDAADYRLTDGGAA